MNDFFFAPDSKTSIHLQVLQKGMPNTVFLYVLFLAKCFSFDFRQFLIHFIIKTRKKSPECWNCFSFKCFSLASLKEIIIFYVCPHNIIHRILLLATLRNAHKNKYVMMRLLRYSIEFYGSSLLPPPPYIATRCSPSGFKFPHQRM